MRIPTGRAWLGIGLLAVTAGAAWGAEPEPNDDRAAAPSLSGVGATVAIWIGWAGGRRWPKSRYAPKRSSQNREVAAATRMLSRRGGMGGCSYSGQESVAALLLLPMPVNARIISSGRGKMMVEFCSTAISVRVCR